MVEVRYMVKEARAARVATIKCDGVEGVDFKWPGRAALRPASHGILTAPMPETPMDRASPGMHGGERLSMRLPARRYS